MHQIFSRIPRPGARAILLAVFLIVAFATFGRSISQGFAPIDDSFLIRDNIAIRGITLAHLKLIFTTFDPELYIPLTLFTFQINYLLSGLHTELYHITNILLHAFNAFFVVLLLEKLLKQKLLSIAGGLLFLVHPLHTEAVVWLAGRKDLLSTFFVLLSLLFYIRVRERRVVKADTDQVQTGGGWYAFSVLFFLLALLSKVMAATLPIILFLYDLTIEKRAIKKRMFFDKVPYLMLSAIFLGVATVGKERILSSSTLLETMLMAGKSTVFYLQKLFAPTDLSPFYPFNGEIAINDPQFFIPSLIVLGLLCAAGLAYKRASWITFGILFFLVTLSPTFFNFHKGSQMFFAVDRYAYFPSIGILFLLVMLLGISSPTTYHFFASSPPSPNPFPRWGKGGLIFPSLFVGGIKGGGIILILVPILSFLSYQQSRIWDSAEVMLTRTLRIYPESITARTDLARIWREQGKVQEAFDLLIEGLTYGNDPALHIGAGLVYAKAGQADEAEAQLLKAANLDPTNPEPIYYLGSIALQIGNLDQALKNFEQAVSLDSSYVAARVALGRMYVQRKRNEEALLQFQEAVSWNPSNIDARVELATLFENIGRFEEAEEHWVVAETLDPQVHDRVRN